LFVEVLIAEVLVVERLDRPVLHTREATDDHRQKPCPSSQTSPEPGIETKPLPTGPDDGSRYSMRHAHAESRRHLKMRSR